MSRYYGGWAPYVPVAERRRKAEKEMEKLRKKGTPVSPVKIEGKTIAATFWGKAWCDNLEGYGDYENRLPRGRTYVRNGSVVDLQIAPREVTALVSGSSIYKVKVTVGEVAKAHWKALCVECSGGIDSLVELLQGRFSKGVMERICRVGEGLFPKPAEIKFTCSCPDFASMCKHVAAVLYGVGVRLDEQPELLFRLRSVDAADLVAQASAGLTPRQKRPTSARVLDDAQLADVFGIEIAAGPAQPMAGTPRKKAASKTTTKTALGTIAVSPRKTRALPNLAGAAKTPATKSSKAGPIRVASHKAGAPLTPPPRGKKAFAEPAAAALRMVARKPAVTGSLTAAKQANTGTKKGAAAKPVNLRPLSNGIKKFTFP